MLGPGRNPAAEATFKRIDVEVRSLVAEAADYAATSPEPDAGELATDLLL